MLIYKCLTSSMFENKKAKEQVLQIKIDVKRREQTYEKVSQVPTDFGVIGRYRRNFMITKKSKFKDNA